MNTHDPGDTSGRSKHSAADPGISQPDTASGSLQKGTLTFLPLLALVVGSMIGGGIFNISRDAAGTTAPGAAIIAWTITAVGMCALALCFQNLANRRPDLDAGVYAYARALLGRLAGFLSAWGYWFSAWVGNIAYLVLLFSTLSLWFKGFGSGATWIAIAAASVLTWALHTLVLSGVRQAAIVNLVSTIAKLVPIFLFIIIVIFAFNFSTFIGDFWGTDSGLGSIFEQTKGMMLVTVWVFIGIEGASIYSARAKNRRDVGKATVIGFILVLVLLMLINLLSHGILQQAQLAGLKEPAMAGILESVIGRPGAIIVSVGLIISVFGALLAWIMIPVEIMQVAGEDGTMPKIFGKLNKHGSPAAALWLTSACMQVMLIITGFMGIGVYQSMISLSSVLILIPYLLSAMYAFYLALSKRSYENDPGARSKDLVLGFIASVYGIWLLYGAGPNYLLLGALLYAPGLFVHAWARRERGEKIFRGPFEMALAALLVIVAIVAAVMLANGSISL